MWLTFPACRLAESGWSAAGLTTDMVTIEGHLATVQCSSRHLTSFACLVDVGGAQVSVKLHLKLVVKKTKPIPLPPSHNIFKPSLLSGGAWSYFN